MSISLSSVFILSLLLKCNCQRHQGVEVLRPPTVQGPLLRRGHIEYVVTVSPVPEWVNVCPPPLQFISSGGAMSKFHVDVPWQDDLLAAAWFQFSFLFLGGMTCSLTLFQFLPLYIYIYTTALLL